MLRHLIVVISMLSILLLPVAGVTQPAAAASEDQLLVEDSLVDVWVFEDKDRNGVYSSGDVGFTDVKVCLLNQATNVNSCVGTDYGDVWWEITEAGKFATWVDAATIPGNYKLNSIQCRETRTGKLYNCSTYKSTWRAKMTLPYGTRINVFYALVPVRR